MLVDSTASFDFEITFDVFTGGKGAKGVTGLGNLRPITAGSSVKIPRNGEEVLVALPTSFRCCFKSFAGSGSQHSQNELIPPKKMIFSFERNRKFYQKT